MVTHVVMFTVKNKEGSSRDEIARDIKEKLESMQGRVPHFYSLEVGINRAQSETASDVVLISRHKDWAALSAYADDPIHREIGAYVVDNTSSRSVVDYES